MLDDDMVIEDLKLILGGTPSEFTEYRSSPIPCRH